MKNSKAIRRGGMFAAVLLVVMLGQNGCVVKRIDWKDLDKAQMRRELCKECEEDLTSCIKALEECEIELDLTL